MFLGAYRANGVAFSLSLISYSSPVNTFGYCSRMSWSVTAQSFSSRCSAVIAGSQRRFVFNPLTT